MVSGLPLLRLKRPLLRNAYGVTSKASLSICIVRVIWRLLLKCFGFHNQPYANTYFTILRKHIGWGFMCAVLIAEPSLPREVLRIEALGSVLVGVDFNDDEVWI